MAQALPAIGEEVSQPAGLPPIGGEVYQGPTFRTHTTAGEAELARIEGETSGTPGADELARITPDPARAQQVSDFFRHLWSGGVAAGQLLPWPKALGGSGWDHPLFGETRPGAQGAPNVVQQMHAVKRDADERYKRGDYIGAAAKYVESVVPVLGPMLSQWGDEAQGHRWGALTGDTTAAIANLEVPAWLKAGVKATGQTASAPPAEPPPPRLSPAEAASNDFARANDIPLDAATATGSRFVRGVQTTAGQSLGGSVVAERMRANQDAALTSTGRGLAESVAPEGARTPEAGGQGVRDAIGGLVKDLSGQADAAYQRLRDLEASPEHTDVVEKTLSGAQKQAIALEQQRSIGRVPSDAELQELRRIHAELDNLPYNPASWTEAPDLRGNAGGGHWDKTAASGGAPVYEDILSKMPTTASNPSLSTIRDQVRSALETGNFRSEGAKAALEVASKRAAGDWQGLNRSMLPLSAGDEVPRTQNMQLAVDLRPVKQAVQSMYDGLRREGQLAPLMGDKARALVALDRIVNGPDMAPLSVADGALGDLKQMARTPDGQLRTVGQGKIALEVKNLEAAVQERAAQAGPEVQDALAEGRAATIGKHTANNVLQELPDEPVKAFDKLTAARDGNIALLRRVQEQAPQQVQNLGRAWLEQALDRATANHGRFEHAAKLYADWERMGDATKGILYGSELTPALDKFFLLAKRIAENPNPSGTALTAFKGAEAIGLVTHPLATLPATLTSTVLARMMYTPRGVAALTRWLEVQAPKVSGLKVNASGAVSGAVREAATLNLLAAAQRAQTPAATLPAAAQSDQSK